MAKSERQKLKLMLLADILTRETDETHGLTTAELQAKLAALGVAVERKTLYTDLALLEDFGMDMVRSRDTTTRYSLVHRAFELPELKLLVDAVQSCKFLSERKSRALITKLESLASRHEAHDLQRQVYVAHRVKSMNESVYYSIDTLHAAIAQNRQIAFRYFTWTVDKTQQFRHAGKLYAVSPYALVWDDEMYYLIAYDAAADDGAGGIRHYRVDKMHGIDLAPENRAGHSVFEGLDMAVYTQATFGMFGGDAVDVELLFASRLAGAVLDRFGKNADLIPSGDAHFRVRVRAVVSPQFMGFVAGFGAEVKILSPQSVADDFAALCRATLAQYSAE